MEAHLTEYKLAEYWSSFAHAMVGKTWTTRARAFGEQAWAERRAAEINFDNSGVPVVPSTATIPIAEVLAAPAAQALAAPAAEALAAPAAEALDYNMPAVVMAAVQAVPHAPSLNGDWPSSHPH